MFNSATKSFTIEINKVAKANVLKKLASGGVDYQIVPLQKLNELVEIEANILKADTKKVGAGIAIGIGISILSGGLF
jgi:hypothetical protein